MLKFLSKFFKALAEFFLHFIDMFLRDDERGQKAQVICAATYDDKGVFLRFFDNIARFYTLIYT